LLVELENYVSRVLPVVWSSVYLYKALHSRKPKQEL